MTKKLSRRSVISWMGTLSVAALSGCASLSGSPELAYEFTIDVSEVGVNYAIVRAEGIVKNTGNAKAKDVKVTIKWKDARYGERSEIIIIGNLEAGERAEYVKEIEFSERDLQNTEEGSFVLEVNADNVEKVSSRLD